MSPTETSVWHSGPTNCEGGPPLFDSLFCFRYVARGGAGEERQRRHAIGGYGTPLVNVIRLLTSKVIDVNCPDNGGVESSGKGRYFVHRVTNEWPDRRGPPQWSLRPGIPTHTLMTTSVLRFLTPGSVVPLFGPSNHRNLFVPSEQTLSDIPGFTSQYKKSFGDTGPIRTSFPHLSPIFVLVTSLLLNGLWIRGSEWSTHWRSSRKYRLTRAQNSRYFTLAIIGDETCQQNL